MGGASPRRAADLKGTCQSHRSAKATQLGEQLHVAFGSSTRNYCSSNKNLADQCKAFCGDAIPILVGSKEFGFNSSAIDDVCLNSEVLKTNTSAISACHEKSRSIQGVKEAFRKLLYGWP